MRKFEVPIITRRDNKVICPNCSYSEEVSKKVFSKMNKIPWINYIRDEIIKIPLRCPKCKTEFRENFSFL